MPDTVLPAGDTLMDRAFRRVTGLWRDMADRVGTREAEAQDIADQMRACLAGRGGEVSARGRAALLATAYRSLDAAERVTFLQTLAGFDADGKAVEGAIAEWAAAADGPAKAAAKVRMRRALEAPRIRLLQQFAAIPDGIRLLVDLREDLLRAAEADPLLGTLEADLKSLLGAWFDVGFLELRRIDWNSPAALLEKLIRYEVVHRIESWEDLKNRLDSDRRCYAFFHPRMPEEPLIFVEIALVKGLASSVQALLDPHAEVLDAQQTDTAIFYSINNCQRGLDGIAFGNFLIKRVVEVLGREFPNLKHFATLSPVPGFCRWLTARDAAGDATLLTPEETQAIRLASGAPPDVAPLTALHLLMARPDLDAAGSKVLEAALTRLCARWVAVESGRNPKRAADPVAHFHLSNGARVERVNWRADTSGKGMRESAGLMVNYLYDPAFIEDNHEAYVGEGKRAMASVVRKLLKA